MSAGRILKHLKVSASPKKAEVLSRFFKTGPGEYGEGDVFLGLTMPEQRKITKEFRELAFSEIEKLLSSPYHEARMTGLLILVDRFERADEAGRKEVYDFLIAHRGAMNNWDLVDVIVPKIVGAYLEKAHPSPSSASLPKRYGQARRLGTVLSSVGQSLLKRGAGRERKSDRKILSTFAQSDDLWERRIAILATFSFIREDDFDDTLAIAEVFLDDPHDLIRKATGWMLREVGKRDLATLRRFLDAHASRMPRTMLRYAIEKLPEAERKGYMNRR